MFKEDDRTAINGLLHNGSVNNKKAKKILLSFSFSLEKLRVLSMKIIKEIQYGIHNKQLA
jgi:hypothetical protein